MATYDVKRALTHCYAPKNTDWELVEVPPQQFIAADGSGDPNTSAAYTRAVEALYAVAYTLKSASKRTLGRDFTVAPLEGLWWAEDPQSFITRAKDEWRWTMLISQPDWITPEMVGDARRAAQAKKGLAAIAEVRRTTLSEATCAQVLHIGPYDEEGPVLARLHHDYLAAHSLHYNGLHHEIYLSDPRRSPPEKLKTVLRQPVRPAS